MRRIVDYEVVKAESREPFEELIVKRLEEGWVLHGSLVVHTKADGSSYLYHDLVKFAPQEVPPEAVNAQPKHQYCHDDNCRSELVDGVCPQGCLPWHR